MSRPLRHDQVPLENTTEVHIYQRMCRGEYLMAEARSQYIEDDITGQIICLQRRQQFIRRLNDIQQQYPVQLLAYAVLNNHFHLCLIWQPDLVNNWSNEQIARRWWNLHPQGKTDACKQRYIEKWTHDENWQQTHRKKFKDIGFFNKDLKQGLAQKWNAEDNVNGPVFNKHYGCQIIENESQRLSTMAYIELNEYRAKITDFPENASYSSFKYRQKYLQWLDKHKTAIAENPNLQALAKLDDLFEEHMLGVEVEPAQFFINFMDRASRIIRPGKQHIPQHIPHMLKRLQSNPNIKRKPDNQQLSNQQKPASLRTHKKDNAQSKTNWLKTVANSLRHIKYLASKHGHGSLIDEPQSG